MDKLIKAAISAIVLLLCAQVIYAQAPLLIPYQGLARMSAGALVTNQAVGLRFTLHDSTAGGNISYQEAGTATTDQFGRFTYQLGSNGNLLTANLGAFAKFMQVEMDPSGGTSYTNMGTQQLMSVPYALFADKSGTGYGPAGATGPTGPAGADGTNGMTGPTGASGQDGTNGTNGANGNTGPTGPNGAAGAAGPTGAAGAPGSTGSTGATGPAGGTGYAGSPGVNGPAGPAGATGADGTNGTNGTNGATGASGPTGVVPTYTHQGSGEMNYYVAANGIYPTMSGGGIFGSGTPVLGVVYLFAGNFAIGYECNGPTESISANTALFSIMGVNYGGNGTTTFQMPNLSGKMIVSY